MKLEAKARLQAGLSPILFHVTGVRAAASILKANRFELKPSEGTEAESGLSGGSYYLSTARSPTSSYIATRASASYALFELDGAKLATQFKGKSVDYWGPEYYKGPDGDERAKRFEAEDRVLSSKRFIPVGPYVRAVYVLKPEAAETNTNFLQSMYDLKKFCMLRKIPCYFFEDAKDLLLRNIRKAVKFMPTKPGDDPDKYVPDREILERKALNPERKRDSLGAWYALYQMPKKPGDSYDQIAALGSDIIKSRYKTLAYDDAFSSFSADLHNAKTTDYGSDRKEREHLDLLVDVMRKLKQTPKQFIDTLRAKWYPRNYK